MTDHAFIPGVLCSCVEDELRHFFREAELRVMGKPALPTQQQRYGVLAGLLLSERCRWRAVLAPTSHDGEQVGHSILTFILVSRSSNEAVSAKKKHLFCVPTNVQDMQQ